MHSREMIFWSKGARIQTSLELDVLKMAGWRKKQKDSVIIHSDNSSQFGI